MERAGNGASGKRCDIDGVTRTGELAGVSESSRDIDGQTREGERAGENESIGRPHVSANSTRRLRTFYSFGDDDARIRHDWVLMPFHLIEIISRLCCFVHLRIWNGTKERNTDTGA